MNYEKEWLSELQGKTLRGVRPSHDNGPVPEVDLMFTDNTTYRLSVKPGVFFEACLINTLRKAQPVDDVLMAHGVDDFMVEIRARTFPLIQLNAVNKELAADEFPFELKLKTDG